MEGVSIKYWRHLGWQILLFTLILLVSVRGERQENGQMSRRVTGRHLLLATAFVTRIFVGQPAQEGRYSYMTSLRSVATNKHFCGGILINSDIVLTAAHCVDPDSTTLAAIPNPKVVIGGHATNADDGEVREVCSTIIHSNWKGSPLDGYDIALMVLKSRSFKTPISITGFDDLPVGQTVSALGWGFIDNEKSRPPELQIVNTLRISARESCRGIFGLRAANLVMCADGEDGEDTCQGDSGGPLFLNKGHNKDELIGVTSFGPKECGTIGIPGVYTKMSKFRKWIDSRGAGESRRFDVPFCRSGSQPVSSKDRFAAFMSEGRIDAAAGILSELVAAGRIEEVSDAVVEVSLAGRAEHAVQALLRAVQNGVAEEDLIRIMNIATGKLPAVDKPVTSGGGVTENETRIISRIRNGDVDGAAQAIADAVRNSNAEAVLQAVSKAAEEGRTNVLGDVLEAAITRKGVKGADLATILSPLCGSDETCVSFLVSLATI